MTQYQYILEPYNGLKSRFRCPNCQKTRCFSKYIDTTTNIYIDETVGRCSREVKCGYHYTPKQYFQSNPSLNFKQNKRPVTLPNFKKPTIQKINTLDWSILKRSLSTKHSNNFITYLNTLFTPDIITKLKTNYLIGTSKVWNGATVFWQVDVNKNIRSGKVMLYDVNSGKRIKKPYSHITWVHKALKIDDYNLKQCFYGEHLLLNSAKPVAIVESEKTAIIASALIPEFTWLASGSLTNLNAEKTNVLSGKQVILFPDLGAYSKWKEKIHKLNANANYQISDLLERKATATERKNGWDIADYLIAFKG